MTEVCHYVSIEPHLQPITGETFPATTANTEDGARSDIAADGSWGGRFERTFFDVRVFNPYAPSNQTPTQSSCYRKHENIKKREYELRIWEIERASFTPIVLSSTGGMGSIATTTYKRWHHCKWGTSYSQTMGWLRCCLSFSLLRSSIQCIRGARSNQGHAIHLPASIELTVRESLIPLV